MKWYFVNYVMQVLDIIAHILDPSKEMESKVCLFSKVDYYTLNLLSFGLCYFSTCYSFMKDR